VEFPGEALQEAVGGESVEVFHDPIVGHDVELARGEHDGEEPVVVFSAVVIGIGLAALFADAGGAGAAVVTVGDIGKRDLAEGGENRGGLGPGDAPDRVLHGDVVDEVIGRLVGGDPVLDEGVNSGDIFVGQKDGAGVGAEHVGEAGAVVLFDLAGFFVFFDDVVFVVLDVAGEGDAHLGATVHDLTIEVEAGLGLADEDPVFLHLVEVGAGVGVDFFAVGIDLGGELEFGALDAEKAVRESLGKGAGFVGIDDVVRDGGEGGGEAGSGDEGGESFDSHGAMGVGVIRLKGGRGRGNSYTEERASQPLISGRESSSRTAAASISVRESTTRTTPESVKLSRG